jgi:hypothetical protein
MGNVSADMADAIAVATENGSAYQGPATVYLAACTSLPTKSAAGSEPSTSGTAYARLALTQAGAWESDDEGGLTNHDDWLWDEATGAGWGDIVAIEAWDNATVGVGNRTWSMVLSTPVTIVAGQRLRILAGKASLTVQ